MQVLQGSWTRQQARKSLQELFAGDGGYASPPPPRSSPPSAGDAGKDDAIVRLLDACDLAGVGYEEMHRRLRSRESGLTASPPPQQRQQHLRGGSSSTSPQGAGGSPSPQRTPAYTYTSIDPSWQARADNLAQRYHIPRDTALSLLVQTDGHAGKASRLIAAASAAANAASSSASDAETPPPSSRVPPSLSLASAAGDASVYGALRAVSSHRPSLAVSQRRNGALSQSQVSASHPGGTRVHSDLSHFGLGEVESVGDADDGGGDDADAFSATAAAGLPLHRSHSAHPVVGFPLQPHESMLSMSASVSQVTPTQSVAALSRYMSRHSLHDAATHALSLSASAVPSPSPPPVPPVPPVPPTDAGSPPSSPEASPRPPPAAAVEHHPVELQAPMPKKKPDSEWDTITWCELLTPVGDAAPGRYILAARRAWGCVAFFTPPAVPRYHNKTPGDVNVDPDALTFQDIVQQRFSSTPLPPVYMVPVACVLFVEIAEVGFDESRQSTQLVPAGGGTAPAARTRSSRSATNLGLGRLISPQGAHIRIRFPLVHFVNACRAVRRNVEACLAHPFPLAPCYNAELYRDGQDYYPQLMTALLAAKETIFIAGWYLTPFVFLDRSPLHQSKRLDNILQKKAYEGVRVRVLLYAEVEAAIPLASSNAQTHLEGLHPTNIQVIRHRGPLTFTHHQKFVVVDETTAFVGGLDLTWGRFDLHAHPVTDESTSVWPGLDYRNPVTRPDDLNSQIKAPFTDVLQRDKHARMPWHDVHVKICGASAYHLSLNFVQRWNHHLDSASSSRRKRLTRLNPSLMKSHVAPSRAAAGAAAGGDDEPHQKNMMTCRVMRSLGDWSSAVRVERCIQDALVSAIRAAKHTVYIENQFFISSLYGPPVVNLVGSVIADRINQAARARETFRVLLVLQPHGEGSPVTDPFIQRVMHFQNATLRQLVKRVRAVCRERVDDYLHIACLRNYGFLPPSAASGGSGVPTPVSSTVYVHSKLLVVDDEVMLIGSANINDRSLVGDRDSEIAVLLDDTRHHTGKVRRFRQALVAEHLGVEKEILSARGGAAARGAAAALYDTSLCDDALWSELRARSAENQKAFESVFPDCPTNAVTTVEQAKRRAAMLPNRNAQVMLSGVKGHICEYPLGWLQEAGRDKSMAERAAGTDFFV